MDKLSIEVFGVGRDWNWLGREGAHGPATCSGEYTAKHNAKRGAIRWCKRHHFEPVFEEDRP